jgi:hypothetical protein
VVGLIKNNTKVPFISLDSFVNTAWYQAAREELENYKIKQDTQGLEVFVGYNGTDWNTNEFFQKRQRTALPNTTNYINTFSENLVPFNIRWEDPAQSNVLIHQDIALFPSSPWKDLIPNYKQSLKESIKDLKIEDMNGLEFDYDQYLKEKYGTGYGSEVKAYYKLHMIISSAKSLYIYDNMEDKIHDVVSLVSVFNARDYHDTRPGSHGISIQFPMHPYFLKKEIQEYLELI